MYHFKRIIMMSLCLICLNSMANESLTPTKLFSNCEFEQRLKMFDGSCLILGIYALKKNDLSLYDRIEKTCMNWARRGLITSENHLSSFLPYFPKCDYVYNQKTQRMSETLNSQEELKRLVRFLNN